MPERQWSDQVSLSNSQKTKQLLHVAKCNLGKVNLEAMLSINRWRQEARLQPWRLAGALCDAYTQLAASAGRL